MQKLSCFKAYDIRGKLGDELNVDIAYRIGRAMGVFLKPDNIIVGSDNRLTSEEIKSSLSQGLIDEGVNVIDIGTTGSEEVYFATMLLDVDGGVEITASHNPINYNGMKLVRSDGQPISSDTGLLEIKKIAEENNFSNKRLIGTKSSHSILPDYIDHIMTYVKIDNFKDIKIVINSGNGAAGHVIDAIEDRFNKSGSTIKIIKIHNEPDGTFPNGIPNPLLPERRQDTINAVKYHEADMGIAFDGDFDRCFFFDNNGKFVEGYYIVGLLAEIFLQKEPNSKVIHDPRLFWNTIDIIERSGGTAIMSKTGHAFIKERMREEDAIYGGEMSAHHYFRDFSYCDSGMIPWLLITELLCIASKPLSEIVKDGILKYPSSGEINSNLKDPKDAVNRVLKVYHKEAINIDYTDGISLEFSDWRFNLRASNTEPVVRLNVESIRNVALMKDKTTEILNILRE